MDRGMVLSRLPRYILIPLVFFMATCLGVGGFLLYRNWQQSQQAAANPNLAAAESKKVLLSRVKALVVVPDEDPTVALVSDATKLKDQRFFANAENGDQVLIFTNAKKAILYRPSLNRVVEIAPITAPASDSATAAVAPVRVVIYNGTTTKGLAAALENKLQTSFPGITILKKDNAVGTEYAETVVVDLTGTHATDAKGIAEALNGVVKPLPKGETKPADGDVLVIVGGNFKP